MGARRRGAEAGSEGSGSPRFYLAMRRTPFLKGATGLPAVGARLVRWLAEPATGPSADTDRQHPGRMAVRTPRMSAARPPTGPSRALANGSTLADRQFPGVPGFSLVFEGPRLVGCPRVSPRQIAGRCQRPTRASRVERTSRCSRRGASLIGPGRESQVAPMDTAWILRRRGMPWRSGPVSKRRCSGANDG